MAVAIAFLCFLVLITPSSHAADLEYSKIKMIHDPLIGRPLEKVVSDHGVSVDVNKLDCLSWRLGVETNNIIDWDTVPEACEDYTAKYMLEGKGTSDSCKTSPEICAGDYKLGKQYRDDCDAVVDAAIQHAQGFESSTDGKAAKGISIWVFDIDDTALSNLPYYARPDVAFGTKKRNRDAFTAYIKTGKVPAHPAILRLYRALIKLGIKAVFLSGSSDDLQVIRTTNLEAVGYKPWEKIIFKPASEKGAFKSRQRDLLVAAGYTIVGNIGDQWSDLLGSNPGNRTFKLPNPMYYVKITS